MNAFNIQVGKGNYNLTTNARRKVVGRNKQLDEGAGRQIWKCLDPLNCVALAAFRKHGTWVQIWHMGANMDLEFSGGGLYWAWALDFGHIRDHLT